MTVTFSHGARGITLCYNVTRLPPATIFRLSPDVLNIIPAVNQYIRLVLCYLFTCFFPTPCALPSCPCCLLLPLLPLPPASSTLLPHSQDTGNKHTRSLQI